MKTAKDQANRFAALFGIHMSQENWHETVRLVESIQSDAVASERERCARIADLGAKQWARASGFDRNDLVSAALTTCAGDIRRTKEPAP